MTDNYALLAEEGMECIEHLKISCESLQRKLDAATQSEAKLKLVAQRLRGRVRELKAKVHGLESPGV